MEHYATHCVFRDVQYLTEVPRNRLAFTVRVSRQVDTGGIFGSGFQFVYDLTTVGDDAVFGLEIVFDIYAHLGLLQISDVTHRSLDRESIT